MASIAAALILAVCLPPGVSLRWNTLGGFLLGMAWQRTWPVFYREEKK